MIRVKSLTKSYRSTLALDSLTLKIPDGAVFGLLGPNGAGKTTFLRLVMGFVSPDSGELDLGGLPPASIGFLPERAFYPARFSIRDQLTTLGRLAGLRGSTLRQEVDRLLGQVQLHEVRQRRLGACSRGMLQRLGLAQALLGNPPLLLLDEPALGLDPAGQKFIREQIAALHRSGKTVILSSHHLDEITRTCTHIAVIDRGRMVRAGPLDEILAPRTQVTIVTGLLPADLAAQLASLAPELSVSEEKIVMEGEAVVRKAEVLRLLLARGVDIRQLSEQQATLEEVYLEATGE
jgi:ABC-2 type transport system ATP-binding protein